jgi:hypothetical protein
MKMKENNVSVIWKINEKQRKIIWKNENNKYENNENKRKIWRILNWWKINESNEIKWRII